MSQTIIADAKRNIDEVRASLAVHIRTAAESCIRAGLDLIEAKEILGHGNFLPFLKEFGISSSTAANWMQVAREIGLDSPLARLSYGKVLALLSLPAEEREPFAAENSAENKSTAEIKRLIAERNRAMEAANTETARANEAENRLEQLQAQYDDLACRPPIEKKIVEVAPRDYQELKRKVARADRTVEDAMQAAMDAERRAREAEAALEDLRTQKPQGTPPNDLALLSDAVTRFISDTQRLAIDPGGLARREKETDALIRRLSRYVIELQNAVSNAAFEAEGAIV